MAPAATGSYTSSSRHFTFFIIYRRCSTSIYITLHFPTMTQTAIYRHTSPYSLQANPYTMDSSADKEERKREVCSTITIMLLFAKANFTFSIIDSHRENFVSVIFIAQLKHTHLKKYNNRPSPEGASKKSRTSAKRTELGTIGRN
jgi:hypothetical protein